MRVHGRHGQVPREMTRADMDRVRDEFVRADAHGAIEAGFDMLELHCAHGYLLSSFISPLTNRRTDEYGGSLENRLRFPLEVFRAMRAVWPARRADVGAHLGAPTGSTAASRADDAVAIARAFNDAGADIIDVSAGPDVARRAKPVYGRMFQTPFSDRIRNEAGIPTIAVGNITDADQVNSIIAAGRADLVRARPAASERSGTGRCRAAASSAIAGSGGRAVHPSQVHRASKADALQRRRLR